MLKTICRCLFVAIPAFVLAAQPTVVLIPSANEYTVRDDPGPQDDAGRVRFVTQLSDGTELDGVWDEVLDETTHALHGMRVIHLFRDDTNTLVADVVRVDTRRRIGTYPLGSRHRIPDQFINTTIGLPMHIACFVYESTHCVLGTQEADEDDTTVQVHTLLASGELHPGLIQENHANEPVDTLATLGPFKIQLDANTRTYTLFTGWHVLNGSHGPVPARFRTTSSTTTEL